MFANTEDSPEQKRILRHLKELFYTTPEWKLRQLCVANDWNLDLCVNQCMPESNPNPIAENKPKSSSVENVRASKSPKKENSPFSEKLQQVGENIRKGYRIMVLMRGLPGSGKTYTAQSIVNKFVELRPPFTKCGDFIFSTDDYFYNSKGVYKYNVKRLSEAHNFNQKRVRDMAVIGFSPIIVDNTNLKMWEMEPYVKFAVENRYIIEVIEPTPPWNKCAYTLAERNIHGVPLEKIWVMMDKYEKGDVSEFLKRFKTTKYTMSLPQLRLLPRLAQRMEDMGKGFVNDTSDISEPRGTSDLDPDAGCWDSYETNAPKGQRKKFKSKASPSKQKGAETIIEQEPNLNKSEQQQQSSPMKSSSARDVYSLLEQKLSNVWKPYEAESIDFWATARQNSHPLPLLEGDSSVTSKQAGEKSLIDLLRDEGGDNQMVEEEIKEEKNKEQELVSTNTLDRHSVGCPNENASFVTLRQIYPNKEVCGLWDLYVKCNADIDWAIDILLKEDELAVLRGDSEMQSLNNDMDTFVCSCNDPPPVQEHIEEQVSNYPEASQQVSDKNNDTMEIKLPQRPQRSRFVRPNQLSDPNLLEVKENIENCFVLGDDHYSKHLLKIRNFRSGGATTSSVRTTEDSVDNADEQIENINDADDNDNDDDDDDVGGLGNSETIGDDMMEMSLGEHLVQQLLENFRNESSLEGQIPHSLPLNLKVFMPRSLAKQLYMLWIESAYNHLEEERQKMVREDEEFARLLKHPKYSEYKQSPTNIREMLDIEYAWNLYKRDQEELDQQRSEMEKLSQPTDLATHLTQMKLCETFPDIPRETLLDILTTTDNNYNETVSILRSTMNDVEPIADHRNEDELQQKVNNELRKRSQVIESNTWDENDNNINGSSWSPEDAKRLALKEFEEARNLAAHHCQLRAECYQKAKEAVQAGNGGAGIYYSQIANLHKQKIDMYNHRAANCIMNVHKYTQNNPDHLDLHYLHLLEAMGCLDLFLDRHITSLRIASRNYKYVFIITGRGKHSAGGVAIVKAKVKARLEERSLKWSEVNPGLLKVKVFSSSRHSQNF